MPVICVLVWEVEQKLPIFPSTQDGLLNPFLCVIKRRQPECKMQDAGTYLCQQKLKSGVRDLRGEAGRHESHWVDGRRSSQAVQAVLRYLQGSEDSQSDSLEVKVGGYVQNLHWKDHLTADSQDAMNLTGGQCQNWALFKARHSRSFSPVHLRSRKWQVNREASLLKVMTSDL